MSSSSLKFLGAAIVGFAFGVSAHAAEPTGPASVSESAPAKSADKDKKGASTRDMKDKAGAASLPSKGPASVNESAPQKTGKEPPAPAAKADSANMPNPKTPSSVSESAPGKTADKDKKGSKKGTEKEATAK